MSASKSPIRLERRGDVILNRDFEPILTASGLRSFDDFYAYSGKLSLKKEMAARTVVRIELGDGEQRTFFYLKRHQEEKISLRDWLQDRLWGKRNSQGAVEFNFLCAFRAKGLATVTPVATGTRRIGALKYRSFLLTLDFAPYQQLEKVLKHTPEAYAGSRGQKRRKLLLQRIASLARQMHACGYNHRDFNATHILLHDRPQRPRPSMAVFDLQRVDTSWWLKWRWAIKTLAEVNYSLPSAIFSDRDRRLLFRAYKGRPRLSCWDRLQWVWIRKKTARIGRHTEKMLRRRAARRRQGLPER